MCNPFESEKNIPVCKLQGRPHVEKCPFAIQFLGTYVIVMGVSNLSFWEARKMPLWGENSQEVCTRLNTRLQNGMDELAYQPYYLSHLTHTTNKLTSQ